MDDNVVTMKQLVELIKREGISPTMLFDDEALKDLRAQAKADGYAEGMLAGITQKEKEQGKKDQAQDQDKDQDAGEAAEDKAAPVDDKYLDPAHNPMIPGSTADTEDKPEADKKKAEDPYLDPAKNPMIKLIPDA